MIIRVHAAWLVPIVQPVIRGGWIDVDTERGTIAAIGKASPADTGSVDARVDLGDVVVLPGLINAHTHLELSHLAGHVPPADGFVPWVRRMLAVRFATPFDGDEVRDAIAGAIGEMEATGTVAVGDIGNTDAAVVPLAASGLAGVHFREALGFRAAEAEAIAETTRAAALRSRDALRPSAHSTARSESASHRDTLRVSVAPHAPYSSSAPLIRGLARGLSDGRARAVSSIHVAESADEGQLLADGTGALRELLSDLGAWDDTWQPPRTGTVPYLADLGALHDGMLAVHGTHVTDADLGILRESAATLVTCPRSNRWVGVGDPPIERFVAAGVRLALGTDSLASVADLNLFAELSHLASLARPASAAALLRAATLGGADALGLPTLGRLAAGASWRAVVRMPPPGVDVEQWLVEGAADTSDLRWLDRFITAALSPEP